MVPDDDEARADVGRMAVAPGADASPAARAPQAFERAGAAACQAANGAVGFRPPTARLRLRPPSIIETYIIETSFRRHKSITNWKLPVCRAVLGDKFNQVPQSSVVLSSILFRHHPIKFSIFKSERASDHSLKSTQDTDFTKF